MTGRRHVAIFANPAQGQALPALAVIEELVRRGYRVTYATSSEVAARLALSEATGGWDVVGFLDDSSSPVSVARGYFADDRPDLVVYDSTASEVARAAAETWDGLPDDDFVDASFGEFLSRFGLAFLPEKPSLYRVVPGRVAAY
ncbi:hypothetical protein SAMN05216188_10547 [Lentzea xinjiangensis]|uniref:Uncharacterized protein n=1 Tax=Lentzea xinjiangensis TaxID=402600 RepID=A0A1H9IRK0_9PSEU|nr:hypothetical protein [Lentzea xinjiangensis]SEQ77210.1 hypothetical protein SAMN05216188_10547 [Lentzea xinjiangensis]